MSDIKPEKIPAVRIDKLLSNMGYGSRREVGELVDYELVTLDNVPVSSSDMRVSLTPNLVERMCVDGMSIDPLPGIVLMLNKPVGVTCSHKEAGQLVYSILPDRWRRRNPAISTVGRLDKDTSGLLILTDNGVLLHKIISPRSNVTKYYHAVLEYPLSGNEAEIFASGNMLLEGEDEPLLPVSMDVLSPTSAYLTLREGRYHQVRRMFTAVKNNVISLHRDRIGQLLLPKDLSPGQYRIMSQNEVNLILS
jgi:16S rRNA pseudouridine516 synthase